MGPTSHGVRNPHFPGSSAPYRATFPPPQVFLCPSQHRQEQTSLSRASYERGPGKPSSFPSQPCCVYHLSYLSLLSEHDHLLLQPNYEKELLLFFPVSFCTAWWHLEEGKRQKATTNDIGDEKGEATLPFLTCACTRPRERPREMCGRWHEDRHSAGCLGTLCASQSPCLTAKGFFFPAF